MATIPYTGQSMPATGPTVGGGTNANALLQFLGSNGGSSLISGILGGLGSMGQANAQERMFNQQMGMNQQQLAQQMALGQMNDLYNRDALLTQQAPTGWAQNYEQQNLVKSLALQKLMNGGNFITPTNPDIASRLSITSAPKLTMPEDWASMNPFGVDQTMQSLAQRQGVLDLLSQGRAPGMDFAAMGYDPTKAAALNQSTAQYRQFAGQDAANRQNQLQQAINMSPNNPGQKGGYSVGAGIGGAASGALTGATIGSIVPGIGTGIGAGIGALVGLFKGKKPSVPSTPAYAPPQVQAPQNPYAYLYGGGNQNTMPLQPNGQLQVIRNPYQQNGLMY